MSAAVVERLDDALTVRQDGVLLLDQGVWRQATKAFTDAAYSVRFRRWIGT